MKFVWLLFMISANIKLGIFQATNIGDENMTINQLIVKVENQNMQISYILKRLTAVETENDDLKEILAADETERGDLKQRLATAETEKDDLKQRMTTAETGSRDLKQRLTSAESKLASAETVRATILNQIKALEQNTNTGSGVSFMGIRTTPFAPSADATITYDITKTNIGGRFVATTGVFTAPKSGVYLFLFSGSHAHSGGKYSHMLLYRNGENICSTSAGNSGAFNVLYEGQFGNSAIISVSVGDTIYVRVHGGLHVYSNGWKHIVFAGAYLHG